MKQNKEYYLKGIEVYKEEKQRILDFLGDGWKTSDEFDKQFNAIVMIKEVSYFRQMGGGTFYLGGMGDIPCLNNGWWIDLIQNMVRAGLVMKKKDGSSVKYKVKNER